MNERQLLEQKQKSPAIQKLLRTLRFAEGTERGGPDSYRVMFGGSLAPDLKRHPDKVITSPGGYASSAAGAYQFLTPSWQSHAKALGLQDFSAYNQDLAATRAIRNRLMPIGGLATLEKEGFSPRVSAALAPEWASLPTESGKSYYGQPVKSLSELQKVFGQDVAILGAPPATPVATGDARSVEEILSSALGGIRKEDLEQREEKSQGLLQTVKDAIKGSLLRSAIPGLISPGGMF
jgi:muramidase (phage lysozyme)